MRSCWPWDKINIFLRYGKLVSVEKVDDTFGVALAVVIVDAVVPSSWCCC